MILDDRYSYWANLLLEDWVHATQSDHGSARLMIDKVPDCVIGLISSVYKPAMCKIIISSLTIYRSQHLNHHEEKARSHHC